MRFSPVAVLLFFLCIGPLAAQDREQVVRLPGPNGSTLVATVIRPPGEAKSPLVVINRASLDDLCAAAVRPPVPARGILSALFNHRGCVGRANVRFRRSLTG